MTCLILGFIFHDIDADEIINGFRQALAQLLSGAERMRISRHGHGIYSPPRPYKARRRFVKISARRGSMH